ncbi:MAG TPA: phage holin family protein [Solirubrobacteraceae bacterium]|nr:phage holin family protein [Solirubrobacteraceae bacterium]
MAAEDHNSAAGIADAINQISERASNLVREEIELAKAEVTDKLTKLVKGAVVGGAAAIFAIFGLVLLLEGFAWLAWFALPVDNSKIFWGFFLVAGVLFILGGLAGFLAAKLLKSGAPPVPAMAINEAKKTKQELS